MNQEIEIIPIAIQASRYNLQIANLVEHLLSIDRKMYSSQKLTEPKGA